MHILEHIYSASVSIPQYTVAVTVMEREVAVTVMEREVGSRDSDGRGGW